MKIANLEGGLYILKIYTYIIKTYIKKVTECELKIYLHRLLNLYEYNLYFLEKCSFLKHVYMQAKLYIEYFNTQTYHVCIACD